MSPPAYTIFSLQRIYLIPFPDRSRIFPSFTQSSIGQRRLGRHMRGMGRGHWALLFLQEEHQHLLSTTAYLTPDQGSSTPLPHFILTITQWQGGGGRGRLGSPIYWWQSPMGVQGKHDCAKKRNHQVNRTNRQTQTPCMKNEKRTDSKCHRGGRW